MEGASLRCQPRRYAQLPIRKVTIGRSQLSLLESDDFLEKVMAKNPLHPVESLSKDLNDQLSDNDINIIIAKRPTRESLKMG